MADLVQERAIADTSAAPLPLSTGTDHLYTDELVYTVDVNKINMSYADLLGDHLQGCGRVDLVSISIEGIHSKAGDFIYAGFCAKGTSATIRHVSAVKNGLRNIANNMTVGQEVFRDMIPQDILSRQIQPTPADLPVAAFMLEKSEGCSATLIIRINVHGIRTRYKSLK
jgi:hypothetical protein